MRVCLLTSIVLLTACLPTFPVALVNVPLEHWSYHFIERLQAKGILAEYLSNSKPYFRGEMAEMIVKISTLLEDGRIHLTDVESELLEEMEREFAQELAESGNPGIREYKRLLNWRRDERMLIAEVGFAQHVSLHTGNTDTDAIHSSTLEVLLYGDMMRNISFYNRSKASYAIGDEKLLEWMPNWKRNDPRYRRYPWSDSSDAYIVFGKPWINIQVGKDAVRWGPGYHGVIGLAATELTFDMVRLRTRMWKVNFTSLLGFLRDDLTKEYKSDLPAKYLSAHRFEITPIPGICIAWQEVYIYAENLHIELLNPIMPYQMAEDHLGGIGNNTMEGDIEISLIPNTELYASLFLDDFHPDKSPFKSSSFGWAALCGTMIADPFGMDNTDVILEYARVDPWTYTHKGTRQDPPIPTAFKHFDEPLGHWIGPNADDLFAQIGWRINKNIHGNISYNMMRHGEIGGNIYNAPTSADKKREKRFLEGIVEKRRIISLGLDYTIFHRFEISASYRYIKTENKQKDEVNLPRYAERRQAWEAGWDTAEHELGFALQLRY